MSTGSFRDYVHLNLNRLVLHVYTYSIHTYVWPLRGSVQVSHTAWRLYISHKVKHSQTAACVSGWRIACTADLSFPPFKDRITAPLALTYVPRTATIVPQLVMLCAVPSTDCLCHTTQRKQALTCGDSQSYAGSSTAMLSRSDGKGELWCGQELNSVQLKE